MFSNSFLFVIGVGCLSSVILTLPTSTNELLSKLPPELAEILFGQDYGQELFDSLVNGDLEALDPADPGGFKPETRLFQNLFNLSAVLANAQNDSASITVVPLITILSSIFNITG